MKNKRASHAGRDTGASAAYEGVEKDVRQVHVIRWMGNVHHATMGTGVKDALKNAYRIVLDFAII